LRERLRNERKRRAEGRRANKRKASVGMHCVSTHHRSVCSRSGALTVLSTNSVDVELNLLEFARLSALSSSTCRACEEEEGHGV
jgi:hypothetical protein